MALGLLVPAAAVASQSAPWRPGFPAFASTKLAANEREIGGEIVILQGGEGSGEGGCSYVVPVVRYPAVKDAIGYRAVVYDTYYGNRTFGGPPFDDDFPYGAAPAGTHQHGLAGAFGAGNAQSCSDTAAYYRGRMKFLSAVAIFKPDDTPRIVGTVRKADGAGRAGARVTAVGPKTVSTKTDATGYYRMKVKKGRYTVSAKGYCVVGLPGCKSKKVVNVRGGSEQVDFQAARDFVHYRVELKAWIPVPHVVDPLIPVEDVPYLLVRGLRGCPGGQMPGGMRGARDLSLVTSLFRGDSHLDYDGSFRVMPVAEFAWDGERISEFRVSPESQNYGRTYNDLFFRLGALRHSCSRSALQTVRTQGRTTSKNGFTLAFDTENPMTPLPRHLSPSIDAVLRGRLSGEGQLELDYTTDLFPDHGIRVVRDGVVQDTRIVNDLSCLRREHVTGEAGLALLFFGLSYMGNSGAYVVPPEHKGFTESRPGYICAGHYVLTQVFGRGAGLGGTRAAAAGTKVAVAPVVDGGIEPFVPLAEAERRGIVATASFGDRLAIMTRAEQPVLLRVTGRNVLVENKVRENGVDGGSALYGPVTGELVVDPIGGGGATHDGQPVGPRELDRTPPQTTATASIKRGRAVVRLRATDDSGVAVTVAYVGKRALAVLKGKVRMSQRDLRKLRFLSIDVFGNREPAQRLPSRTTR